MPKSVEIICEYQPYVEGPPVQPQALRAQACSNDAPTLNAWHDTWVRNVKANHARFGSFAAKGLGQLWGRHRNAPAIVIGSGPSLKGNAAQLKSNPGIPTVSCLHNFHYLEDLGVGADYYVTLDAGPVTIEEVSEGGTKTAEEYWALTKSRKLIAYIATDPRLLELWQGEIYLFNCPLPDDRLEKEIEKLERFKTMVSTGGNVFGAATYIAKGIFGCNPIVWMGADFAFSYQHKFHGWDSKYDANLGHTLRTTDVYGNSVRTWQSYANFKAWFDWVSLVVPGLYINCSEGGTLGAYQGGNIRSITQMDLSRYFEMQTMCEKLREQCENPGIASEKISILF